MAPKKNENKTALNRKTPKEKLTKGRIKKDSPKSKKQIIRVKIQLKNNKNDTRKDTKKKSIVDDAKKMLAFDRINEVARAQLVKDCPVEIESTPQPVAKRGRKLKIKDPGPDVVPKKKPKGPPKGPPKVQQRVKKSKATAPKQKNPIRNRGRPPLRGKLKTEDDSTITSPSILSQGLPECITPVKPQKSIVKSPVKPAQKNPDSRRTSVTSEWSWTKEMSVSGSSTTTCFTVSSVSCTDFVCIDGKLPEIKLNKISVPEPISKSETIENMYEKNDEEHSLSEDSSSSSSSCSSSSSSSSSSNSATVRNGLNLSTSSISPIPHSPTYTAFDQSFDKGKKPDIDEVSSTIEMLAPKLKSFDLSFPDIGNENDYILDMKPFEEKVFKILEEEYNAILECNFLNQLLSEKCSISKSNVRETEENEDTPVEEPEFTKPDISVISNKNVCDNRNGHNDLSSDSARHRDSYDPNDDDDALSLFAESLTGMDSSRLSSAASDACAPPACEEYVPQPLGKKPALATNYQPTKIHDPEISNTKSKPICEKKNADSTSIHKEQELEALTAPPENSRIPNPKQNAASAVNTQPQLTIRYYRSYGSKSWALRDVCFFNLSSTCKNKVCRFDHRTIEDTELSNRLAQLSEERFFREYMSIAKWPVLKRKYVTCFINECQRRELPKILVEIVIDFLSTAHKDSAKDSSIKVNIIESTLMYLNSWNLAVCEQLLTYRVGDKVLCDVFMEVIGNTQNFSRFKNVFISLAGFMVRVNRTFDLDVVAHILERVCILPFEAPLAEVLVAIIEKTDRKIFDSKMMQIFEMQLSSCNKELNERLLNIKEKLPLVEEPVRVSENCPPALPSPCGSKELEPPVISQNGGQHEQRYTSPDTTNVDNVNKSATDPVFIRTINLVNLPNLSKPPPPCPPQGIFSNWNARSILQQIPRMPHMRPQLRPNKRPMGQPLGRAQFKYQRRYGSDFYGNH